ncbi:hypothetical protein [Changpingibacter yushuensis]|uniref:hypothetical protein n=1 Tax=Changpingibacter yushuensis TaxID=2758440 RepID=UPI0015F6560C|nr:hypothetical protein [Changpingibacter yushuensis]
MDLNSESFDGARKWIESMDINTLDGLPLTQVAAKIVKDGVRFDPNMVITELLSNTLRLEAEVNNLGSRISELEARMQG